MRTKARAVRRRPLAMEGLEDRSLMAVFSSAGGMLFIQGTGNDDVIVRQQDNGRVQVSVNGGTSFQNAGVVNSIFANLGGGNDILQIGEANDPLTLMGNVIAYLGDGADNAFISVNTIGAVIVDGGIQPLGGAEFDRVEVFNSFINTLSVNTWGGDDIVRVDSSIVAMLNANLGVGQISQFTFFGTQSDDDFLDLTNSAIGNVIGLLGTGENDFHLSSTLFGNINLLGGNQSDFVAVESFSDGIGANLANQIVSLVDDLEPFLEGALSSLPPNLILSNIDQLFSRLDGVLGNLPVDLDRVIDSLENVASGGDLSDEVAFLLSTVDLTNIGRITTGGSLIINTFGGNDGVSVGGAVLGGNLLVLLGAGNNDWAEVYGSLASLVYLDGGAGGSDDIPSLADLYDINPLISTGRILRTGAEGTALPT